MSRSRNIKPGFYKNEDLAECSVWARLLFPGMWMLADRAGRMEDRPKRIKGEIFPFDSVEVCPLLDELEQWKFILRYEKGGVKYIQITTFSRHQRPHSREKASEIPPPDAYQAPTLDECDVDVTDVKHDLGSALAQPSHGQARPDSLIPDSLIPVLPPSSFANAHEEAPPSGNSLAKKITFKVWKANVKARGEKLISGYQPVWDYAEKLGIPGDWIEIAWLKFADRYDADPTYAGKRYADWRRHFLNAIEGNWFGLWRVDQSGKFSLTTVGVQADIGTREAA